jgi:hypothetical protein
MYPNKGKFTRAQLKNVKYVKKKFGREHMWVLVNLISPLEDILLGTLANTPIFEDSPSYGDRVSVAFNEIEDIALQ